MITLKSSRQLFGWMLAGVLFFSQTPMQPLSLLSAEEAEPSLEDQLREFGQSSLPDDDFAMRRMHEFTTRIGLANLEILQKYVQSPDQELASGAAQVLFALQGEKASELLIAAMKKECPVFNHGVIMAFGKDETLGKSLAEKLSKDTEKWKQLLGLELLGYLGDKAAAAQKIAKFLDDEDTGVSAAAVNALSGMGETGIQIILNLLGTSIPHVKENESDPKKLENLEKAKRKIRIALDFLGQVKSSEKFVKNALPKIRDLTRKKEWDIATEAYYALYKTADEKAGEGIAGSLTSIKDPRIQAAACIFDLRSTRSVKKSEEILTADTKHEDIEVRRMAARSLGYAKTKIQAQILLLYLADPETEVENQATESLKRLTNNNADDEEGWKKLIQECPKLK